MSSLIYAVSETVIKNTNNASRAGGQDRDGSEARRRPATRARERSECEKDLTGFIVQIDKSGEG